MTKDEMKNRISIALKDPILQQGFEIICKENEELKEINEGYCRSRDRLISMGFPTFKDCKEYAEHFTKAKEIILKLYNAGRDVLMCRAEEKAYDNLSNAINDKSIEKFLQEVSE